jgi:hypothetical protein
MAITADQRRRRWGIGRTLTLGRTDTLNLPSDGRVLFAGGYGISGISSQPSYGPRDWLLQRNWLVDEDPLRYGRLTAPGCHARDGRDA